MDSRDDIFDFILSHPNHFSPNDINGFVEWLYKNQDKWLKQKQWIMAKERAAAPAEDRKVTESPVSDKGHVIPFIQGIQALIEAGFTDDEIQAHPRANMRSLPSVIDGDDGLISFETIADIRSGRINASGVVPPRIKADRGGIAPLGSVLAAFNRRKDDGKVSQDL